VAPTQLTEVADDLPPGAELRLNIQGEDAIGNPRRFVAILPLGEGDTGEERLMNAGLEVIEMDGDVVVDMVAFGSAAADAGLEFDQMIEAVLAPQAQPWKELMYIPALILLGLIIMLQRRRREQQEHRSTVAARV